MSTLSKSIVLLVIIVLMGAGLVFWKQKYGGHGHSSTALNRMSKEEMELLLKDANPMMLDRLAKDPELKKQQLDSIRQLLALASEAMKDPEIYDANTKKALEIIESVIWARTYDQEINKDKGPMPPFGFIGEDRIKEFYGEGDAVSAEQKQHAAEFEEFLQIQLNFARKNKAVPEGTEPSQEEKDQMKLEFAKIKIYDTEARAKVKSGEMGPEFAKKVELQAKLQKAQFLSRMYSSEKLAKAAEVTDEDIAKYLAEHPELNTEETKKTTANEVLQRLKNGEDFAKLAKEFSEDPGSKDKGGLYEGVTEGGGFDKAFEAAALALEPGQFTQELVSTPFGFHIIKLEKKGEAKDPNGEVKRNYDVRHILFSTMIKDPENPMARELPVKDFIKQKLEDDKQKKLLDELVAKNDVQVAEDFVIPTVSEEQMKEMMQKQMQQQMPQIPEGGPDGPDAPAKPDSKDAKKPAAKKPAANK